MIPVVPGPEDQEGLPPPSELLPPSRITIPGVPAVESSPEQRVWQSEQLLGCQPEVIIMHQGKAYRLRSTRQGKLILYK